MNNNMKEAFRAYGKKLGELEARMELVVQGHKDALREIEEDLKKCREEDEKNE